MFYGLSLLTMFSKSKITWRFHFTSHICRGSMDIM